MRLLPLVTLVALLVAGCSADPGSSLGTTPSTEPAGEPVLVIVDGDADGPGITVAEAITHGPTDDIVVVTGALFVDPDGTVRLCDALAESFPPQCGGERIVVEGLNLNAVAGLQTEGGVSWAESVTLLGSVQ